MIYENSLKRVASLFILITVVSLTFQLFHSVALSSFSGNLKQVLDSINYRLSYSSDLVCVCVNPSTVDDCLTRSDLMISRAKIELTIYVINDTHARVDLVVRGNSSYDAGQYIFITDKLVGISASYIVDVRYNFAWVGNKPFGFFPFFIFPAIGYDNITSLKFVYMGKELRTETIQGRPVPTHFGFIVNETEYSINALVLANEYLYIDFVYHIPVRIVRGIVPINETAYLVIKRSAFVDNGYIPLIASMSDYPRYVAYIDYERLALFVAGVAVLVVAAFATYKLRRRR